MICPNLKDPAVRKQFDNLKEALGEPLAYYVWDKNGGNYLDKTSTGKDSALWKNLIKDNSEVDAIKLKSRMFSGNFTKIKAPIEKVPYDWNKPASEQSRQARDNAKLDLFLGVLTNEDTFVKGINPGNFDLLKDLADPNSKVANIATQKGLSANETALTLPTTSREMFVRNMTGKALIGIFVNHSVNHSIVQYSDLKFKEPINIAGHSLTSLTKMKGVEDSASEVESLRGINTKDLYISRMLGTWVGAAADNAKEPVASQLNVSTFTADVLCTLVRSGLSMETSLYILNQPAIVELSDAYFKAGGRQSDYTGALSSIRAQYKAKLSKDTELPNSVDISKKDLFTHIKKSDTQEHLAQQLVILELFDQVNSKAAQLANVVRMLRPDNLGRQIRTSSNEVFETNVQETMKDNPELDNLNSLWTSYPMMKSFYDNAVTNTTKELNKWFPWNEFAFSSTKQLIKDSLPKNSKLSDTQIDYINTEMMGYMASEFEFFDGSDRDYILRTFPKEFEELKKDESIANNALISRLFVENKKVQGVSVDNIKFRSATGLSEIDKDRIRNHWEQLLSDPKTRKLGENLIKYSYYAHGFFISPRSFSHLIPVGWFRNVQDSSGKTFNDYMDNILAEIKTNQLPYSNFVDQFFRNNWQNKSYVKELVSEDPKKAPTGVTLEGGAPVKVELTEKRNGDLVTSPSRGLDKYAEFVPYLVVPYKKKKYLFVREEQFGNKASYKLDTALGLPGLAKEYDKNTKKLRSVFSDNKVKAQEVKVTEKVEQPTQSTAGLFSQAEEGSSTLGLFPTQEEVNNRKKECE